MNLFRGLRARGKWLVFLATALTLLCFAASASAASGSKPYALTIAPGTPTYETASGQVASGETVGITATIKNETSTQQLGSANLFWPSGFTVEPGSASASVGSASVAKSCSYLGASAGPCVQLRQLNLAPGSSATITMTVATPACEQGSGFRWFAEAKQANNYSGSPGNDLTYDASNSQPNTTLDGACSLSWSTEPANAQTNAVITSSSYAAGSPPAVTVLDANDNPISTSTLPVTASLATNLFATLNGTSTQPAIGGVASFADLSINAAGTGYELGASSGMLTGATSSPFNVTDQVVSCPANGSCSATDGTSNGNKAQVNATTSTAGLLLESVNANNSAQLKCTGYTSADPNTYQFDTPSGWSKVVTLTIRPLKKLSGNANQILKAQQICFGAPEDFITASGTLAPAGTLPDGTSGFIGLLPNCTGSSTGPCHARNQDTTITDQLSPNGFDLVLVADIPAAFAGDPHMG
jgi:hypothetical protein